MESYSISQAAERSGFTPSALRFYEQSGLVKPERTASGYRSYDDRDVETLQFIGRAKGFGLTLDEITEVIPLLAGDACAPVQARLRDLVDRKIVEAQARVAELIGFTAELQRVAGLLARHTPEGPCDEACGCASEPVATATAIHPTIRPATRSSPPRSRAVALIPNPTRSPDGPPIACTLSPDRVGDRLDEWRTTIAQANERADIDNGIRLCFATTVDVAAIAALAAAEQDCCRFFTFNLSMGPAGVALDVTGPADARPLIDALIGAAT